jgi:hypothetical protein
MSSIPSKMEQSVPSSEAERTKLMKEICVAVIYITISHSDYTSNVLIERAKLELKEQEYSKAKSQAFGWKTRVEYPKAAGTICDKDILTIFNQNMDNAYILGNIKGWLDITNRLDKEIATLTNNLHNAEKRFCDGFIKITGKLAEVSLLLGTWLAVQRGVKLVNRVQEDAQSKIKEINDAWAGITFAWEIVKNESFELENMQKVADLLEYTCKIAVAARDVIIHKIEDLHSLIQQWKI